jgi:hypothetical protein
MRPEIVQRQRESVTALRFEEFRLRHSLVSARSDFLGDHSRELRANSPFAISLVRLRDAAVVP